MCGTHRRSYRLYHYPNFRHCILFVSLTKLQTDRQTDGWTDDPIIRCPLSGRKHKNFDGKQTFGKQTLVQNKISWNYNRSILQGPNVEIPDMWNEEMLISTIFWKNKIYSTVRLMSLSCYSRKMALDNFLMYTHVQWRSYRVSPVPVSMPHTNSTGAYSIWSINNCTERTRCFLIIRVYARNM